MVIWIEDKILPVIQMPFGWRTIQGSDYFQPFEHRTHSKNKICVSGYQPMALIVAGGGAWKHYVFGIHMVKCVRISNGLQFSKGLGKITAIVFRFWMVCSDFKWFGFWNGQDHSYSYRQRAQIMGKRIFTGAHLCNGISAVDKVLYVC